jgi:hypothetical protein
MTREPNDPLSRRLFEAARREPLSEGAEGRALAAALREASARSTARPAQPARWAFGLAAAALAAAFLPIVLHREAPERISAEPERAARSAPSVPSARAAESPASTSQAPLPARLPARALANAPSAVPAAAATLTDELGALKVASTALGTGDARAALIALDRYDHVLKGSKLRAEATLLRIQALARSGDVPAASALAQRFVEQNPDSPLVDRARSFVQQPGLGGN